MMKTSIMDLEKEASRPAVIEPDALAERLIPSGEWRPDSIDSLATLPSFREKLEACGKYCNAHYTAIDHAVQDALVLRRLQQITHILQLNPLWKERIEQAGLTDTPRNFEEWQQIPVSDKDMVRAFYMGERPGLVVPLHRGGFEIVASGGTTCGHPVETVYTMNELHDTYRLGGDFLGRHVLDEYMLGEGPKWVTTTYIDTQMWSSGTMVGGVMAEIPESNYIPSGTLGAMAWQRMLSYPGPKAVVGTSQGIGVLGEFGPQLDEEVRKTFRVAMFCSGMLPLRKQVELKNWYPNVEILSYFSATQAEAIAMQLCPDTPLVSVPGLYLIEIVDEDGRWVKEGEEGECLITRLHTHEAPLPRFKLGDRMIRRPRLDERWLKTHQFEFAGRSGDIVHIQDVPHNATRVFTALCRALQETVHIDLEALGHEIQFLNNRATESVTLLVAVDKVEELTGQIGMLGERGVRDLFVDALIDTLTLFYEDDAVIQFIKNTSYRFNIKPVRRGGPDIYRTVLGKVPLIKDIF